MQTIKRVVHVSMGILALWTTLACTGEHPASPYKKGDKEYGTVSGAFFRHRWWNYYERGVSFAEGEFYKEAMADLREAIHQRDQDQRMARTYGMHFIDYFPHRELGIIEYEMGNLEAAQGELELSLSQYPSAKARFYLDRVRKALIERQAKEVAPPRLTLNIQAAEVWTKDDPVLLSGVVEDESYVADITIGGVPFFLEGSATRVPFQKNLILSQGHHSVEVQARNLMGKASRAEVIIHVDREGPLIVIEDLTYDRERQGGEVRIQGTVHDEGGVAELLVNGEAVRIQKGEEVFFSHTLATATESLDLLARDRLGNETSARFVMNRSQATRMPLLLASSEPLGGSHFDIALFEQKDTRPPNIYLKLWTDNQTVFLDKAYLEGQVSDESKIVSLTINQVPVLRGRGTVVFFNHVAELKEGENIIVIEARDEAGNTATKKVSVIRRIPKAMQLAERLSLTVLPFEQKGEVSDASFSFRDNLIDSLVAESRFRVIERDRLDLILKEQEISRSKLIDRSTALKVGKLAAAESIVMGSIVETRTGIEIVSRMFDTETSDIVATADVYGEVKDLPALRYLAQGMAIKLHRDFPLVDGMVLEQKGKDIVTDLGENEVKLYRKVIVYREKPVKHPVTGKILGADSEVIGRARVTQVLPKMSKAELVTGKSGAIEPQDKVMTE